MTDNLPTFSKWLAAASAGDSFIYFVGDLGSARGATAVVPSYATLTPELAEANFAWIAYENGLVSLVQRANLPLRPNGTHPSFNYIAQRTSKVRRADPPTASTIGEGATVQVPTA